MLLLQCLEASLLGLLGLLVGSFLNVVVYRLPKIMEREWAQEHAHYSGTELPPEPTFNLLTPRSRCPSCGHPLAWYENLPVLSYLALRGKCSACGTAISLRYPLVEAATAAMFFACGWRWGLTPTAAAWCALCAALLVLGLIDWDTTFLPDSITLPLLWAGLIASSLQWTETPLSLSLWGAVAGYLSLWSIYWAFKLATGKEGMGFGDFKLFAALGAWFGWPSLIPIILVASVIGSVVGIALKFRQNLREGGYIPFGPFLVGAGLMALALTPQGLLRFIGL
jgi:leader peptidase (prepilin peptidase)/N-methyltransferase